MLSMINSIMDPIKDCCQFVLNFITELLPFGVLWNLLGLALFIVLMGGLLYGIVLLLVHLHSGEDVREVTCPFTINHIAFGFVIGAVGLFGPNEQWMTWLQIGFLGWAAVVALLIVLRVRGLTEPRHGKLFYLLIGLAYWAELFVVGMFALLVVYAAIALAIIIIVGFAVAGGMLGSAARPSSSCGASCGGRREVELADGTRIVEEGISWREVGGCAVYRQNFDGTFSKTY